MSKSTKFLKSVSLRQLEESLIFFSIEYCPQTTWFISLLRTKTQLFSSFHAEKKLVKTIRYFNSCLTQGDSYWTGRKVIDLTKSLSWPNVLSFIDRINTTQWSLLSICSKATPNPNYSPKNFMEVGGGELVNCPAKPY